jgi:hypothetical protein
MCSPNLVHKAGKVIIEYTPCCPPPEMRLVEHAQLQVFLIDCAVLFQEELACGWVLQKLNVKAGDDVRQVLLDDQLRFLDRLFILFAKADELCHIAEISTGIDVNLCCFCLWIDLSTHVIFLPVFKFLRNQLPGCGQLAIIVYFPALWNKNDLFYLLFSSPSFGRRMTGYTSYDNMRFGQAYYSK